FDCSGATQTPGVTAANETVWGNQNQGGSTPCSTSTCIGTGGGASLFEPRPAYQSGVTTNPNRATPDVAMLADPSTGVAIFQGGLWVNGTVGGTSLATPLWAGLVALLDQASSIRGRPLLGVSSPTASWAYTGPVQAGDFHDVLVGIDPPAFGDLCV